MKQRERRRHDRLRMVERAKRVVRGWPGVRRDVNRMACRLADNLRICSCWMCAYEKHFNVQSIQDRRRREALADE